MGDFRVGFGYDSHRLEAGLKLRLGGVDIASDRGCVAHSDGDAVIHALCDALLGAAALGDIGTHFPDNDMAFKGIDSTVLLRRTVELLHQKGWQVHNADVTIVAQKPKLAQYMAQMRENVVRGLETDPDRVNVKATTTERMGFEGEEVGISAQAVVLLEKVD